ncbi:response regulator transcription factor [Brachybacterium sp. YJGR34]|uniref:LuxR C-terminal-related transcriptional regulator n=1 Tax=Brachybacterium sp. YJGR34 TaxID=2059911 RepID=UPI000E0AE9B9|nr:response regulator transcription factor [Brachybacterium sp. YJGR34]
MHSRVDGRARPRPLRVSVVEDEALMRSMLVRTIDEAPTMRVVHELDGAAAARLAIAPRSTDVALLDVNLGDGNGIALGLELQRADPRLAVLLLSSLDVMGLFLSVQDQVSEPWSYLSKRSTFTRDVLLGAIAATADGDVVIDPSLVQRSRPRAGTPVAGLTSAQFQVLRLVAEGLSNEAVADRLHLSVRSVESHLLSIYRRLDVDGEGANRRVRAVLTFLEQTGRTWQR